jgi:hypothetical protein
VVRMARHEVQDDPYNSCSTGLHVGTFNYARGFGDTRIRVRINPADVVSVPHDGAGEKIRVCVLRVEEIVTEAFNGAVFREPVEQPQPVADPSELEPPVGAPDTMVDGRTPNMLEWGNMQVRAKTQRKSIKAVATARKYGWTLVDQDKPNERDSYRII